MATTYGNYVKFIRGSEASWSKLTAEQKNSDTLYFISNAGSTSGKLYLGSKLISNGSLTSATSLRQLNDVLVSENITDQSILVYNSSSERWENKSVLDIFISINAVFTGATETDNGKAGLVPAPTVSDRDLFLRGDGTWANPVNEISWTVGDLQSALNTLVGEDTGLTVRQIAQVEASNAVAEILADAPEEFNTLKEIAEWIQDHQDVADVVDLSSRVSDLETLIYGVEADEEAGKPGVVGLQSVVSNLQLTVSTMEETVSEHTTAISQIQEALRWSDLIEE